jgi:hypothetical protein
MIKKNLHMIRWFLILNNIFFIKLIYLSLKLIHPLQ